MVVIFVCMLSSSIVRAEWQCNADLNFGMVISEDQIRVTNRSRTLYQINDGNQLIVGGYWIDLDKEQQRLLAELSGGIHYVVPKMVLLAKEGTQLAVETIEQVYVGLVGKESKGYERIQTSLERAQLKAKEKFIHTEGNYYIGPGSFENVDELVDPELEAQIEQAINTSLGGVLSAIGGLSSSDAEELERRVENLSQRLENLGQEIELQAGAQAEGLKRKAKWFCKKLYSLDMIEESLRQKIPELEPYNVIVSGKVEQFKSDE
jgi:hypothetical protein